MFSKRLQWQRFESPPIDVAPLASASGTINIGAAPGNTPVAPGTLNTAGIVFGAGIGGINFNHTSSGYILATDISGLSPDTLIGFALGGVV